MAAGFIVRLRPTGPWRLGPTSGARDRVDRVLHSDTLYSALTIAAEQIGILAEWLQATAQAGEPVVRVASAFPFAGRTLLAPAPKHVWPPAGSGRTRWKAARFVPLHVVPRLLAYESLKEDRWAVDPLSEAVLPVEKFGEITPPFRVSMRRTAAVDRVSGVSVDSASTACLEFAENAGMWCAVFCPTEWRERVQSLFRFVADGGIGGERSLGWGRSAAPEFEDLPTVLTAEVSTPPEHHEVGFWMLSLFAPAPNDRVDWSRGSYGLVRRSGRTQDTGLLKIESAMVEEGSVVMAEMPPAGLARDIAPEGASHPVYRAGFAVAVPVPVRLPGFFEMERAVAAEAPVATAAAADIAEAHPQDEATPEETAVALGAEPPEEPQATPTIEGEGSAATAEPPELTDAGGPDELVPQADTEAAVEDNFGGPEEPVSADLPDAGGPGESVAQPSTEAISSDQPPSEVVSLTGAEEVPFEDASIEPIGASSAPELPDAGGPHESPAEPIEDALAEPGAVPDPEVFVVETAPIAEQIPPAADGGAFEDSPPVADADADGDTPEDAK